MYSFVKFDEKPHGVVSDPVQSSAYELQWQTASMQRVSAEIDMGTQTNSLKT